jgi:uncharacterized protein (DUF302 family)
MSESSPLIIHSSHFSPAQILSNLQKLFQAKGITIFAIIDHSRQAHKAGLDLPEEQLVIFGDPKTGTYLMQENPAIGIELPLKILLWQDSQGVTHIAYKDPQSLAEAYGIKKNAAILEKMKKALDAMIEQIKNEA